MSDPTKLQTIGKMHKSSILRMTWFRDTFLADQRMVLDVGSMDINGSYKELFEDFDYYGLDIAEGKNVDIIVKDRCGWDIKSESFDVVISGQAFEHIECFWLTMSEMVRVLKPEGLICIIAPRGFKEHRHPVDCWRFLTDGMRSLAKINGLQVLHCSTNEAPSEKDYDWFSDNSADTILVAKKTKNIVKEIKLVSDKRNRISKWINKILSNV